MIDPHDLRMSVANGAITTVDVFNDDDMVSLVTSAAEKLLDLANLLTDHDVKPTIVASILCGLATGAALSDLEG